MTALADSEDYYDGPVPPPDEETRGPLYVDVAALLAGGLPERPRPEVLAREDGPCLFYAGRVNVVFGDPESGKTWLALVGVAESLRRGLRCAYVDVDHNGAAAIVRNLLTLGVPADLLTDAETFRYYAPEYGVELLAVAEEIPGWAAGVVVFDSAGEVLPLLGKASNDGDDWTYANRKIFQPSATAGACVVVVDHLAKNADSRTMGPGGTAAKRRSAGGVMVRVHVREQFVPGAGGAAALTVNKDRPGAVREVCEGTGVAGEAYWSLFVLTATPDDRLAARLVEPRGEAAASVVLGPSDEDLAEIDGLSDEGRRSVEAVRKALGWRKQRAAAALRAWREMQEAVA